MVLLYKLHRSSVAAIGTLTKQSQMMQVCTCSLEVADKLRGGLRTYV